MGIEGVVNSIRTAVLGRDVRNSIADAVQSISTRQDEVDSNEKIRQDNEDARASAEALRIDAENQRVAQVNSIKSDYDAAIKASANWTDIQTQVNNMTVDLQVKGCKMNDINSASDNSKVIQNLIAQGYKNLFVPGIIYIDSTISIPQSFSSGRIFGVGWSASKLIMITDNAPIFQTQTYNTYNVTIEDIAFEYKNQQWASSHPNSAAIYFYTATDMSYGFYHWVFNKVRISKAAFGFKLCDTSNTVVWGCVFRDIQMYDTSQNAIFFNALKGQLGNQFENLKILNYNIRDNTNHSWGKAIIIKGEASFTNLDIEDWYGEIFQTDDGYISFKNVHIERNHLYDTTLYHRIFQINGNCYVENFNYISAVYPASITKFVRIFDVSTAYSSLCVNLAQIANCNLSNVLTFIYVINNPRINLNGVTPQAFTNVYSTAVNPEVGQCTNLTVDGRAFRELFKFSSVPTNIDTKIADSFVSKNIQSGQPYGWVAKCNAYVNPNPSILTAMYASVSNSNNISVSGNSAVEGLKVGDKIILAGVTSEIYTVQSINSATSITTVETVPHTYSSVSIKYATPIVASTTAGSQVINLSGYAKGIVVVNDGIVLNGNTSEVYTITAITPFSITVLEPMTHTYNNVQFDVVNANNNNVFKPFNIIS